MGSGKTFGIGYRRRRRETGLLALRTAPASGTGTDDQLLLDQTYKGGTNDARDCLVMIIGRSRQGRCGKWVLIFPMG